MAAIRKVMVAQRRDMNLRNLPELESCETYARAEAEDPEHPAGVTIRVTRFLGACLEGIDGAQTTRPLFSRTTVALTTAVLVFHLSLAGFTATGVAGLFTH